MWCAILVVIHFTGGWAAAAPKFILTPLVSPSTGQDYGWPINAFGYGFTAADTLPLESHYTQWHHRLIAASVRTTWS
jgi:hypothetical protein